MKLFVSVWPFADFSAVMYDDKTFRKGKDYLIFKPWIALLCFASDEPLYWVYRNQRFRLGHESFFLCPTFGDE